MIPMLVNILIATIFLGVMIKLNTRKNNFKLYLMIAVIGGIISVITCLFVEQFCGFLLDSFFSEQYYYQNGWLYFDTFFALLFYVVIECFLLTGFVEETAKYVTAFSLNEKRQHKLYGFLECIIPFLIIGVIFSLIENYLYIFEYGASGWHRVGIFLGGHVLYAMIFSFFYYKYRVRTEINNLFYKAKKKGIKLKYKMLNRRKPLFIAMLIVTSIHGINNFVGTLYEELYVVIWIHTHIAFIVLLILTIKRRYKNAKDDAIRHFMKLYPEYEKEELKEMEII